MTDDPLTWAWQEISSRGGVLFLLCVVLWGGFRQWWVFGHHYVEMRTERDLWRTLTLSGHDLNKEALDILSSAATMKRD